jgi:glycyl-tRNA synthetase beta chain
VQQESYQETMPDFLLELGLEEIPARMIASAQAELQRRAVALLERERIFSAACTVTSYSTPRRLAVLITDLLAQQPDIVEEITGPSAKIAFKDGVPTPAAEAFARKAGVTVAELKTVATPKGEYVAATTNRRGRSAADVLEAELPKEIAGIYWAKNMYWRAGKPERFVRPVLWIACLLGDEVVPLSFAGKTGGRATYGHRILSSGRPFDIATPAGYVEQLETQYVLADVEARRHKIRKALDRVTRQVHEARWREDEALVDAVTHLTEWPDVLLGNFDPAYLALPEEVLVTVMRDHQKYFAVEDGKGKLAPHFLTVTNIALDGENTAIIRQGNERVLRARFNDARFFWDFDQRVPLRNRVELLENVTFQKDLGSYAEKSRRVAFIAQRLAGVAIAAGCALNEPAIAEAARLAKTDLTTELVKEFTELQGIIGGLYAASQGLPALVADAIYDQYLPAFTGDAVPRSPEGCVLGLADRIDTIAGMFALGMEPTGSKDPFALRRAANGIVAILAESRTALPLLLSEVITSTDASAEVAERLTAFFSERVDFYLRERHKAPYDVVKAVMAAGWENLPDLVARAHAVNVMRGSEDFLAVSAAFKRVKNILSQAGFERSTPLIGYSPENGPESNLMFKSSELQVKVKQLSQRHAYREALEAIATIRPEVNTFFEQVMVMDPDPRIRQQRLTILATVVYSFSNIADFSEIVTAG